jgi:hypothetical protein
VEGGVEDGDVRDVWQGALRLLDRSKSRCVVQRSEGRQLGDRPPDVFVEQCRVAEARTAVNDAMADRVRGLERLDRTRPVLFIDERELQARRAGVDDEDAP